MDERRSTAERLLLDDEVLRHMSSAARVVAFEWDSGTDAIVRSGSIDETLGSAAATVGESGSRYRALMHQDDRSLYREVTGGLSPEAASYQFEYRLVRPDGVTRYIREAGTGRFSPSGHLAAIRGVSVDITREREAELRLTLIAQISDMISHVDDPLDLLFEVACAVGSHFRAQRCLFTEIDLENDTGTVRRDYCRDVRSVAGVYRVSAYSSETFEEMKRGRTVVNNDSRTDPRTAELYNATYAKTGERAYIAVPLLREGQLVAELWLSDNLPRAWSSEDVTLVESVGERVWTAVEKLRINAALRDSEARERRLRAAADEASVAKDHFLALLSHELRTPMTTIVGWSDFLRSGHADEESTRKGIEGISDAARAQARLIDELLDLSRIVTGKMQLAMGPTDLNVVITGAANVVRSTAEQRHQTIDVRLSPEPPLVHGDAMRLQQVLWNLLTNAVKFTPEGGTITIQAAVKPDTAEVRVRDTGIGIDPEFLPHVFERFRQAESGPSRRFGGLGLGLSIVKHLVEAHEGTVRAESEGLDSGSTFTISLPRA